SLPPLARLALRGGGEAGEGGGTKTPRSQRILIRNPGVQSRKISGLISWSPYPSTLPESIRGGRPFVPIAIGTQDAKQNPNG
ncbi:MAG: hypothetical protein QME16_07170, partial [Planctomycetota bacterium]|nr:hypothetical protein [Planctomycetota bacterium]